MQIEQAKILLVQDDPVKPPFLVVMQSKLGQALKYRH